MGTFGTYSSPGVYAAGLLFKTITADENNKQVIEFKDKQGKVILKKVQLTATADDGTGSGHTGWLCTYYIYDDLNNLRCVIQPRGVELLSSLSWALTDPTILAEQCFRYEYDQRNRMILKKVPGAGTVNMVYDARDRLVMTQDANMYAQGKYLVTKYDNLNRPIETGLWTNSTTAVTHRTNAGTTYPYPVITGTYEMLSQTFYDNYNWVATSGSPVTNVNYETTWDTYLNSASNSNWPYPQANAKSTQVTGMVTGSKIKVLGTTSTYLYTVNIYDDKGRVIQVKSSNITGGTDMVTTQYTWAGQPLIIVQKQEKAGTPSQTSVIVTKYSYDELGRLIKTEKKLSNTLVNSNAMSAYNTVATMEYDALGQVKKKAIGSKKDPATHNYYSPRQPLQELNYDYNIRGWLLGMNRDYLTTEGQTSDGKLFGFELGYDKLSNKSDQNFITTQFNGNIAGMLWKSDGDDTRRKYDFTYDAANRLLRADFVQQNTDNHLWNNSEVNYNVKMGDGINVTSAYDANGNIKRMQQWGLKIGGSSQIDDLTYNYKANSNKLLNVGDAFNDNQTKLGDFRVSALNPVQTKTTTTVDYSYDDNGNMVKDLNKDLVTYGGGNGIQYNYLNLPAIITVKKDAVSNKGTITYTYDAAGNKLKKITQEINATVPYNGTNYTSNITTTTTYIGGLVYESKAYSNGSLSSLQYTNKLQFIPDEEGRIRPTGNTSQPWAFDYFIKDHLGNVRMVLTDEQKTDIYPAATLETSKIATEENYYTISSGQVVDKSQATGIPDYANNNVIPNPPVNPAFDNANSAKLYVLNKNSQKTGLGITLKVMAGDKLDIYGKSYYFQNNTGGTAANSAVPILDILTGFLGGPSGGITGAHGAVTATQLDAISATTVPIGSLLTDQTNTNNLTPTKPKAFINYLLFDEQFKCVGSGLAPVGDNAVLTDYASVAALHNIAVNKNGYVYIWCSNESPVDVFFDNLQVVQTKGPILEETHYYPFGLTMAGISSKAALGLENKYKYNGKELQHNEFSDGSGLEAYDFGARMQDPQLGRFETTDPHAENYLSWTPYNYVANNPILLIDPTGKDWFYYSKDGKSDPTWQWHDGHEYKTGVKDSKGNEVVLQGKEAVVVFNGFKDEKLGDGPRGKDQYLNNKGSKLANVTVYGPNGEKDIKEYKGYTMTSDPSKFGVVADGDYTVSKIKSKEKPGPYGSLWTLNNRGRVPDDDNFNPAHPSRNPAYLDGVFIHRPNRDGWAGTFEKNGKIHGVTEGCLLIAPSQWDDFNNQLQKVNSFFLQLRRK